MPKDVESGMKETSLNRLKGTYFSEVALTARIPTPSVRAKTNICTTIWFYYANIYSNVMNICIHFARMFICEGSCRLDNLLSLDCYWITLAWSSYFEWKQYELYEHNHISSCCTVPFKERFSEDSLPNGVKRTVYNENIIRINFIFGFLCFSNSNSWQKGSFKWLTSIVLFE